MSVAKMRMFNINKWMRRVTRENRMRKEYVSGNIEVLSAVDKMKENRLRRSAYVMR